MTKEVLQTYTLRYGEHTKITVKLSYPIRKGKCEACEKTIGSGQLKITQLHHWYYKYKNETVKKNPMLALENTIEVCYADHQIADGLRMILRLNPDRAAHVAMFMPPFMRAKLKEFCERFLDKMGERE